MGRGPTKEEVMLEYRVAVLEAITDWMLANAVFVKAIEPTEMESIHEAALQLVRRRYPEAQVEFKGRWPR